MDRGAICQALAKRIGQTVTLENSIEIVNEAMQTALSVQYQQPVDDNTPVTIEAIMEIERHILKLDQIETPTTHHFAPGLYAREMFIPAGTVLTGAVHKSEHLAIFVGDITVWSEGVMVRLTGHHTFVSKPGAKRVGYAHADTWCTGFFPTEETDIALLEKALVESPELLQCNLLAKQSILLLGG